MEFNEYCKRYYPRVTKATREKMSHAFGAGMLNCGQMIEKEFPNIWNMLKEAASEKENEK